MSEATCSELDCRRPRYCKGLCTYHYNRARRLDPAINERIKELKRDAYERSVGGLRKPNVGLSKRTFLRSLKVTAGCVDCGYAEDPARLHFDHREKASKAFDIGVNKRASWKRLAAEIDKCDVRCAYCHAKRHFNENRAAGTAVSRAGIRLTHCRRGHLLDEANTYVPPSGKRECRACANDRSRRYKRRKRAAA